MMRQMTKMIRLILTHLMDDALLTASLLLPLWTTFTTLMVDAVTLSRFVRACG